MPTYPDPAPFNSAIPSGYWTQLDKFMNSLGYFWLGNPDFGSGSASLAGTAINAMIAAMPAGGGTIWVPPGDWTLDTAVLWTKDNIRIQGVGRASRLLFAGGSVSPAFAMSSATQRKGIQLLDLSILNSGAQGVGTAVDASHCLGGRFSGLDIDGTSGSTNSPLKGIVFNANDTFYNVVENSRIWVAGATAQGVAFDTSAAYNELRGCRVGVAAGGGTAVYVNAGGTLLHKVNVEGGATTGVGVDVAASGHDCVLVSPHLDGNVINLRLASTVESPKVMGGTIKSGSTWNVQDLGSLGVEISTWLNSDPFRYRGNVSGGAINRFILSVYDLIEGSPNVDITVTAGRVYLKLFEMPEGGFVDGVRVLTGATVAGNAIAGIVGPIPPSAEDTAASAPVVVESSSTALTAAATSDQIIPFTKTYLKPGRYYVAVECDNATNTIRRTTTNAVTSLVGFMQRYDRAGGYGALTPPTPAVTNDTVVPWMQVRGAPLTTI